jgi:hypothetical protein
MLFENGGVEGVHSRAEVAHLRLVALQVKRAQERQVIADVDDAEEQEDALGDVEELGGLGGARGLVPEEALAEEHARHHVHREVGELLLDLHGGGAGGHAGAVGPHLCMHGLLLIGDQSGLVVGGFNGFGVLGLQGLTVLRFEGTEFMVLGFSGLGFEGFRVLGF